MKCPKCGGKTVVHDNVSTPNNEIYRIRKCTICSHRFYTSEMEIEESSTLKYEWYAYHRERQRVDPNNRKGPYKNETN